MNLQHVKSVACPRCSSEPDQSCRGIRIDFSIGHTKVRPHKERIEAWQEQIKGQHSLRGLAAQLELVAKDHPCYSQAHEIVQNCVNHLCAVAAWHELNLKLADKERLIRDFQEIPE